MTNKDVRFKAQKYTDRGPTTKFKNEYNIFWIMFRDKTSLIFPETLILLKIVY